MPDTCPECRSVLRSDFFRQRAMVEPPVRFHDGVRKERGADEFESETPAREHRNDREQPESRSERRRARRTSGNERGKESSERRDSRMSFRRASVCGKTVRRHRQVRPEKRGVQPGGKYLGVRVGASEVARREVVVEIVRERQRKTHRAQGKGKSARSATEKSGNLRGHAPILRGFFRQSSTAAIREPSGSSGES